MAVAEQEIKAGAGKHLTFLLGSEAYGVEVGKVREIVALPSMTLVPGVPAYILGVFNLRGKILPVVDLRKKFGLKESAVTRETCLVVFDVNSRRSGQGMWLAVLVDEVQEVINITQDEIGPLPDFAVQVNTDFLLGLARTKTGVKLLLDIEKVLNHEEWAEAESASEKARA